MKWLKKFFQSKSVNITPNKQNSVFGTLPDGPITLLIKNEILGIIERGQGGWPTGLNKNDFSESIMPSLAMKLQQYEIMPNPQSSAEKSLGMTVVYPRYNCINGKLNRIGYPENDAKIVSVASYLIGVGKIGFDEYTSKLAFDAIDHYVELPVSKFMLFIPLVYLVVVNKLKGIEVSPPSIDAVEEAKFKIMENILFEIYEELGEGEKITDNLVVEKFNKIIHTNQ